MRLAYGARRIPLSSCLISKLFLSFIFFFFFGKNQKHNVKYILYTTTHIYFTCLLYYILDVLPHDPLVSN